MADARRTARETTAAKKEVTLTTEPSECVVVGVAVGEVVWVGEAVVVVVVVVGGT